MNQNVAQRCLANIIAVGCLAGNAISLAACLSRSSFQVLPHSPTYLLRSPDSHRTPLPEILKAYNGFEPGHAWIDLEPLMELRVENAYYEPGASRSGLAGFLGTEVARYTVTSTALNLISVQPMKNRPNEDAPAQGLGSSAKAKYHRYRLYYEIVFARRNRSHGSVLLGADSQQEIDALSSQLTQPEAVCYERSTHCTVFPEACSVSVEIGVVVNGKQASVVWGSALRSIAEHPHHLEMKRLYAGRLKPVRLDWNDVNALSLPLLPGDQIAWN